MANAEKEGRFETVWEVRNGFTADPTIEVDVPAPGPIIWPEETPESAPATPEREPELVPA